MPPLPCRWGLYFSGLLRKAGLFIADVSGQRIGPISKDQETRDRLRWDRYAAPKSRWQSDLSCATTQGSEDLNYTVAKVWSLAFYTSLSHAAFNGKINSERWTWNHA